MKRTIGIVSAVVGTVVGSGLAAAGAAHADAAVSIRPADGPGTVRAEGDAPWSRARLAADDGTPMWVRVDRPDDSVSFVYGEFGRCLDLSDPDDAGSAVVLRECAAGSLSQRWERRGLELVDRDSGECLTAVERAGEAMLAGAECVLGDPAQEWMVSP